MMRYPNADLILILIQSVNQHWVTVGLMFSMCWN